MINAREHAVQLHKFETAMLSQVTMVIVIELFFTRKVRIKGTREAARRCYVNVMSPIH